MRHRPFDSFAKPRMRMRICLLETFPVKHRVETMGVAVVYSKSAKGIAQSSPRARLRSTELLLLCAVLGLNYPKVYENELFHPKSDRGKTSERLGGTHHFYG